MKTEAVVIGAGPAGSSAALALSKSGISNILIDKRLAVGVPVQCAEFVGLNISGYVDLSGVASAINRNIKFLDVDTGKNTYRFDGKGYMLNRDIFDRHLAEEAVAAGTKLITGARAYKINRQKNSVDVLSVSGNISFEIRYDYLLAAAGPKNVLGLPENKTYAYAAQVKARIENGILNGTESVICYFRPYIPFGYGWVFPKGGFANVGVGIEKPASNMPLSLSLKWRGNINIKAFPLRKLSF